MKTRSKKIWAWFGIAFLTLIVLVLGVRVLNSWSAATLMRIVRDSSRARITDEKK